MIAILLLAINSHAWTKEAGRELVEVRRDIDCLPEWSEWTEVECLTYAQCNWW